MTSTDEVSETLPSNRAILALLLLAATVPYVATLGFGYVLDDTTVIRSNPDLRGWASLLDVWRHPYGGVPGLNPGLYRPLLMSVFAFVWTVGGHSPFWFHFLAVALHAAVTLMVWRLLTPALDRWPAVLGALWFAVQPVHAEAVANVANSSEVLVAAWTCALALWLRRIDEREGRITWSAAAGAGALYLAAFLSKESGAVAPALAALWVWGWRRPGSSDSGVLPRRWWRVIIAFGAAAVIVFALRALVLGAPLTKESIAAVGLEELSGPRRIWAMLSLGPTIFLLFVWPSSTNPHYGPTTFERAAPWSAAITVTALAVLVVVATLRAKRGDRRMLTGIGWTLVAFLPASNLLIPTGQILAERTLYVASIGVAMLFALAIEWVSSAPALEQRLYARTTAMTLAMALIATFAVRTTVWSRVWRNHSVLFARMIAADPKAYRGYWLLGLETRYQGRTAESLALLDRAHRLDARDRGLVIDYSLALSAAGDHERAASVASELMAWPALRVDAFHVAFYLDAVGRAYGADSVAAASRRLMASAPSLTAKRYLEEAVKAR